MPVKEQWKGQQAYKRAGQRVHQMVDRWYNKTIILAYHRVINLETDPQLLSVSPENFSQQLAHLSQHYTILALPELQECLAKRRVPDKAVVLTFDDGYVDSILHVKPLLEKHKVPATIFVTTDLIGKEIEFWWDELEQLLLLQEALPEDIFLRINNQEHTWNLTHEQTHSPDWNVSMATVPAPKYYVYKELHALLRPLRHKERENALEQLRRQVIKEDEPTCRKNYRVVTQEELKQLAASKYIDIGSHTVTHPVLSALPEDVARRELRESKEALEYITKRSISLFCYPFGKRSDIGMDTPEWLKQGGYTTATTLWKGLVDRSTNPYLLPRFLVRNWDMDTFAKYLAFRFE